MQLKSNAILNYGGLEVGPNQSAERGQVSMPNSEVVYIVVEPPLLHIMQRKFGIPFRPIGKACVLSDGTCTQAAVATLEDMERSIAEKFPERYAWYQQLP